MVIPIVVNLTFFAINVCFYFILQKVIQVEFTFRGLLLQLQIARPNLLEEGLEPMLFAPVG